MLVEVAALGHGVVHGPADGPLAVHDVGGAPRAAVALVEDVVGPGDLAVRPEVREEREVQPVGVGEGTLTVNSACGVLFRRSPP